MSRKKWLLLRIEKAAVDFTNHILEKNPLIPFIIPVILIAWAVERWLFSFSNWIPLALAVWVTRQYGCYERKLLVEDLNDKWKRVVQNSSPITQLEHCDWLNRLLTEVWFNYFNPKLSIKLSDIVEKRLKLRKPGLIERVELQEFSLGSCPPILGPQGLRWSTFGDQRVLQFGLDWDSNEMSILMLVKLAKPLMGTARIVINSLHINGDLLFIPILDGKAFLYSFMSTPEVRIGVAFGSGGSQSLPATVLPGVSSWLVKLFTETLSRTMVEPRRCCLCLPAVNLRKKAAGGIIYVTVISANKISQNCFKRCPTRRDQDGTSTSNGQLDANIDDKDLKTFVEVELEELTRKTDVRLGSTPRWDATFNMILHNNSGTLRFNLYESPPSSVKFDYLGGCEIKMRYVEDDSTIIWAIGPDSGVIAKHISFCGEEVEMVVPFEGGNSGELKVRIVVKEWQFSDGSHSLNNFRVSSQQSHNGPSHVLSTGRKLYIMVMEGKNLAAKDRSGKIEPYVKLQYGKNVQRTRTSRTSNPGWNHKFEFDEIGGGEYLKLKCFIEDVFGDEHIGSAHVNLEGLMEGKVRDVWIPLERVNSGELRLRIKAVKVDDKEGSRGSALGSSNGLIELSLLEARDLIGADLRGSSDPYVRVNYGNLKKKTKVIPKTLNPQWNQTLEFPDEGSPLVLYVKDHNSLLPTSSLGECVVEYQRLPPNQMADKWIPLQGVKRGEIHIQITRKVPEMHKIPSLDNRPSLSKLHQIPNEIKQMIIKLRSLIEVGNLEELSTTLSELDNLEDEQKRYIVQLETEQMVLLNKIKELGREMLGSPSPTLSRRASTSR